MTLVNLSEIIPLGAELLYEVKCMNDEGGDASLRVRAERLGQDPVH